MTELEIIFREIVRFSCNEAPEVLLKVIFVSDCFHAVPCEWPVYNGRSGFKFPLHNGRTRVRGSRSDQQAIDATTQPNTSARSCIYLHRRLILHVSSLHAHETPVCFASFFFILPIFNGESEFLNMSCKDKIFKQSTTLTCIHKRENYVLNTWKTRKNKIFKK